MGLAAVVIGDSGSSAPRYRLGISVVDPPVGGRDGAKTSISSSNWSSVQKYQYIVKGQSSAYVGKIIPQKVKPQVLGVPSKHFPAGRVGGS
jgi:hypothetical protein